MDGVCEMPGHLLRMRLITLVPGGHWRVKKTLLLERRVVPNHRPIKISLARLREGAAYSRSGIWPWKVQSYPSWSASDNASIVIVSFSFLKRSTLGAGHKLIQEFCVIYNGARCPLKWSGDYCINYRAEIYYYEKCQCMQTADSAEGSTA